VSKTEIAYMGQTRPNVCALLSLGNALLHLGLIDAPWDQQSPEFEEMVWAVNATRGSAITESLDDLAERWPLLRVDKYVSLEMCKEMVVKLLDRGLVVAMPIWDDGIGLHSVLIIGHEQGQRFNVVNRDPFTARPVKSLYDWEALGFRRWNVPARVYGRRAE